MHPTPPIALICFPVEGDLPEWPWEKRVLPDNLFHAAETVKAFAAQTDAEYVLFWDCALGQPSIETCLVLLEQPGEVWHAGLQLGCAGQPEMLNLVNPVWMLNLDASPAIASDSWRLSLRACLVKCEIIRSVGVFRADYSSFETSGIEWGYRMCRAGALLRHQPEFVSTSVIALEIPFSLRDSLTFAATHFPRKWYAWIAFRLLANGAPWLEFLRAFKFSVHKKAIAVQTLERPIEREKAAFKQEDWQEKVSVLMPTLNRYPYAINSIEQLLRQTVRPKEILATDQTDLESRWEGFAQNYPIVRVFPQTEKGQCLAWNKLLEESSAPFVLFLGDDADGIRSEFIEEMCRTLAYYKADMVASNVTEIGGAPDPHKERVVKMADGFPITLIRKELVLRAGMMDMAFNKGIRADQDLAIRCRMLGAHMIFDSSIRILHHRAPVGGLRWHKQRVLTQHISKKDPFKIRYPAETEYHLFRKYFSPKQRREHAYILLFSQMFVSGSAYKKLLRVLYFLLHLPKVLARYSRLYR
ncbi:MAG: glycosyltransferase family 2 protein [Saprospiraceae bacterium]